MKPGMVVYSDNGETGWNAKGLKECAVVQPYSISRLGLAFTFGLQRHVPAVSFPADCFCRPAWCRRNRGVEVLLADLHGAYFLSLVPSSIRQIPVGDGHG